MQGTEGLASGIVSMVFGLSAAIMSSLFGKMLASLGYVSMNLSIAVLTLIIGLAGAYFSRAPDAVEKSPSSLAAKRQFSGEQPLCFEGLERASERSLTIKESMHTRSFWFLWITWTLAGAAGVSMTLLSTGYGLYRGFPLESAIFIPHKWDRTSNKRIRLG